ncbi:protein-L-isoaspartate(D-aspartate) O-methyltransferase [Taibaiella lutea]|uniref:Protein-L-isoaspartate O-methyltransferase n=1 Tax=Taibaiella lutea TaxID=2608001 RepID=A0A5M6CV34_9BACT|nr:protein-L-isoaspartate(D-aspartate) O-methyltransferase [Taibaiella lutea]KAA5536865.1 protein-L-isoaspartate(D-aspartate) O-methyltransferase [Taibaiella lutea]
MLHRKEKEDSFMHKGMRKQLIEELREKGIKDEAVLEAMNRIPRHFFLDPAFERIAYEDRAFPILSGQTISQPYTVAYQTQFLEVKKMDKVLEIGTGSAYQACVLAELGAWVFTIERQKQLFDHNNAFPYLKNYPQLKRFYGDGFQGLPSYGPFDKVIITAAAPYVPPKLIEQMKVGGIMIIPVDTDIEGNVQQMRRIIKTTDGYDEEILDNFSFVPMLNGRERN